MIKQLATPLILVFALVCLGTTFFLPWAERGTLTPNSKESSDIRTWMPSSPPESLAGLFTDVQNTLTGVVATVGEESKDAQKSENFKFYCYAFFLSLAMVAAAIGINIIGREESEEKTILPLKK